MSIAGVDVGTTGCKCTIYSKDGILLSEAYTEYEINSSSKGREIDPSMVWNSVKEVIKKASINIDDLTALTVSSFGEATALIDENDCPVMKTILYTDSRGEEQCERLIEKVGKERIIRITGLNPHSNYSISKLMWIKEKYPEYYNKTKYIMLYSDFISYMLTGQRKIDYSLATRTMAFDLDNEAWSKEIFEASGIDMKKMSEPVPTGAKTGYIKPEILKELGLITDVMVITGCHDQITVAIGTGVLEKGMAVDGAGTVECVTPVFDKSVDQNVMVEGNYAKVPYVIPGCFVTYAYSFTGGALLKWYRDSIAFMEAKIAKENGDNVYDMFNKQLSDGPTELLILPHFAGAATPYMDNKSKGAIIGLTLETKSIEIYQALMEAVAFEMKLNLEILERAGIHITSLRASGGGALSKDWLQMKADILDIPITSLGAAQSGTLGCVMLAGVSSGIYESLEQARDIFVKTKGIYYPRPDKTALYMEKYKKYKKLYQAVKSIIE